jgi:hypothetical protein
MASFGDALKKAVAVVAPTLGTALGGPLGGTAGTLLAKALGKDGAPEKDLENAVLSADPETLLKVKAADVEFQKFLKDADIKLAALDNEDRANARDREKALHDRTPAFLAAVVVGGYFGVMLWILKWDLPKNGAEVISLLVGSLNAALGMVLGYFFGSSVSSKTKQATIDAALSKRP